MKKVLISALFFIFIHVSSGAETVLSPDSQLHGIEKYFPITAQTLTSMDIDNEGFFWIASEGGIFKWDGRESFNYNPTNVSEMKHAVMNTVYTDSNGSIWWGSSQTGLFRYDKQINRIASYRNVPENRRSLSSNTIGGLVDSQSIAEDENGVLYIATADGLNIYRSATDDFDVIRMNDNDTSLSGNVIYSVFFDSNRLLWVASDGGLDLSEDKGKTFRHIETGDLSGKTEKLAIHYIHEDKKRNFWFASNAGLLFLENKTGNKIQSVPVDGVSKNDVLLSIAESDGMMWISGKIGSLIRYNPQTGRSGEIKLKYEVIGRKLYIDKTGAVWMPLNGGNLYRFTPGESPFRSFRHEKDNPGSLKSQTVTRVFSDKQDNTWIVCWTENGLQRIDRKTGRIYPAEDINNIAPFIAMAAGDGSIWIGDWGNIYRYSFEKKKILSKTNIGNSIIIDIYEDPHDSETLWITTDQEGLVKFNTVTTRKKYLNKENGYEGNSFWGGVISDPDDSNLLWTGNERAVLVINKNSLSVERRFIDFFDTHLPSDIHFLPNGQCWIATFGALVRIDRLSGEILEEYSLANKRMPASEFGAIYRDNYNHFWLPARDGQLVRFDYTTKEAKAYNELDGITYGMTFSFPPNDTWGGTEIWANGVNGLIRFFPAQVKDNQYKPPVYFTKLTKSGEHIAFDSSTDLVRKIDIPWQEPFFEFTFAALDYTQPSNNKYRYILEGWDTEWYESGTSNKGRYSGLTGGIYTLKVMGSNNDGLWSDNAAELRVYVSSPFWKQWWFFLLLFIVSMGLILFFFIQQKKKLSAEGKARLLRNEMDLAKRIQTALLPRNLDACAELDIAASMIPADEVGGDYYDIQKGDNGSLWISIGDVSGHGVTPGLIMMIAQNSLATIVAENAHLDLDPKELMIRVNKRVYDNVHERLGADHFMTFNVLKYSPGGKLLFSGAHMPIILHRAAGNTCECIDTEGTWLNLVPDIEAALTINSLTMEHGDTMVIYTDGITEAFNVREEQWDTDGLIRTIMNNTGLPVEDLRAKIIETVLRWSGGVRSDDMTLMVIRRK